MLSRALFGSWRGGYSAAMSGVVELCRAFMVRLLADIISLRQQRSKLLTAFALA